MKFKEGVRMIFKNKNYLFTIFGFSANIGNYNSMSTLLNFYLISFGMTDVILNL